MGKFHIGLFAASLFASTTFAQSLPGNTVEPRLDENKRVQSFAETSGIDIVEKDGVVAFEKSKIQAVSRGMRRTDLPDDIITKQPEGKLYKNMYGVSKGYEENEDYITRTKLDGYASDLVVADDGAVYIKNPFSTILTNTWLKGTKGEGDTIEVRLPQLIYKYNGSGGAVYKYYAQNIKLEVGYGGAVTYSVDKTDNRVKFVWRNDTLTKCGKNVLGMTTDTDDWTGYGDEEIQMYMNKDEVSLPANPGMAEEYIVKYKVSDKNIERKPIKFLKEGNDVYIGGLYDDEDFWVKGTLDGDKAVFKKQYLGLETRGLLHTYFIPAKADSTYGEYSGTLYVTYKLNDEISLAYNSSLRTLATDSALLINVGKNIPTPLALYSAPIFAPFADRPLTPADPEITDFIEFDSSKGYGGISFTLPLSSDVGDELNEDNLYFRIYFDDNLFTFTPEEYMYFEEDMTDVPYSYNDIYDVTKLANGSHAVRLFRGDYEKIGVQSVYKGGGETKVSKIIYRSTTGINTSLSDGTDEVRSVVYTDLSGRRVAEPVSGIYIKTTTLSDGSVKNVKVVRR